MLELDFPYRFRILRAPDEQEKAALQFGPYIMAAISEEQEFITVPFDESNVENRLVQKENLEFVCEGRRWIPFCKVGEEVYHVYFICESR